MKSISWITKYCFSKNEEGDGLKKVVRKVLIKKDMLINGYLLLDNEEEMVLAAKDCYFVYVNGDQHLR